jgi:zinc protease
MQRAALLLAALLTSAPAQGPEKRVALPKASESDLDNGLHLVVLEDRRRPVIAFQLLIPGAGGLYAPDEQPGLAAATAALMRQGTSTRSSIQIDAQLQEMSAQLTVEAGADSPDAIIRGICPASQATRLLDLATDILLRPVFADEEISVYRQDLEADIAARKADPMFWARQFYARAVYGQHPAARTGPNDTWASGITRDGLMEFHRTHYQPDHALLVVDGDVSPFAARFYVGQKLGEWKRSGIGPPAVADPDNPEQPGYVPLLHLPNAVQTALIVGAATAPRNAADFEVLEVMSEMSGGLLSAPIYTGEWHIEKLVSPEATQDALYETLDRIARLRDEAANDEAIAAAKSAVIDRFVKAMESPEEIVQLVATRWRNALPADYWESYADRITSVNAEQVQNAAQQYLAPERQRTVVVGP